MKNSELEQLINDKLNSAAISDFAPNGLAGGRTRNGAQDRHRSDGLPGAAG